MQKSLILAAILSLLAGSAYAACPANPADCPATAASVVTTPNLQATGLVHMSGLSSGTQTSCLGLNASANVVTAACGGGGSGGTTPGGTTGQVQYNNSGAFGGLTNTQLTADIDVFTSSLKGAVSASGGGTANFLRADGAWAAPPGGVGGGSPGGSNGQIQYNNSGSFGGLTLIGAWGVSFPSTTTVTAQTVEIPFLYASGTITQVNSATNGTGSPGFTCGFKINGTNVTSCNAISVSGSSNTSTTCTGANTLAAGDQITAIISAPSGSPSQAYCVAKFTHSGG